MILSVIFYGFIAYVLYRLIFGFIIPVYRTTQKVRKGFREMNERMRQAAGQYPGNGQPTPESPRTKAASGDYIEFEEIKD
ncbi:MAG TPA: hypothetical protein VFZ78_06250 [Flavisolibacter sp.]